MTERRVAPYGSWASPITIDMAVSGSTSLREPRLVGGQIYWTEARPEEGGRQVIVRLDEAGPVDVTPAPFNARSMVHEYGGGWYTVDAERGTVYFSNGADGRIYRQERNEDPEALTPEGLLRYGDLIWDGVRDRIVCVREDHRALDRPHEAADGERIAEPRNELVAVNAATGDVTVLATGYDFYSTPRISGDRLAWLCWRHPNMPWDTNELWTAEVDPSGGLHDARLIAGGNDESIVQPEWAPDGSLVYVSDRTGWWNLYRWTGADDAVPLAPMEAEFAGPQWVFGLSWYGIADDGTIVAIARRAGRDELWRIPVDGAAERIETSALRLASIQVAGRRAIFSTASPDEPASLVEIDLDTDARRVLRESFTLSIDRAFLSIPEQIEFPTTHGDTAFALYYPPTNPDFVAPSGERPPLIVEIHGGPTSSTGGGLSLGLNVVTSRGFGVLDVDYRGSTGYGREFMRKLYGTWGVYDVEDCIAAARYLADRGDVDPGRMAIRGGSAGGYTALAALTFHDVFGAGASHYGVGDLEALARFTHKFESRYIEQLVAPYPEGIERYHELSPIYHIDRLSRPLIVFQGVDDMVVPIAQAEQIVDALRKQHIPHAYLPFEGEGHGFRQAANIRRSMEAELSFYAQVFGFKLADDFEPVKVEFLETDKVGE
jgi:dipeptidyl aminopeptidase/acylaminoacyl peptidase